MSYYAPSPQRTSHVITKFDMTSYQHLIYHEKVAYNMILPQHTNHSHTMSLNPNTGKGADDKPSKMQLFSPSSSMILSYLVLVRVRVVFENL